MDDVHISLAAMIVSLIAVALSQCHPLYTYLDKAKLDAELSRLQFFQGWGKVGFSAFVQLWNSGRASGQFSRIDVLIARANDKDHPLHVQVQTFYPIPPSISMGQIATQVPWSHVILVPDGSWSYWVSCFAYYSDEEQTQIDELTSAAHTQLSDPATGSGPKLIDQALFDRISTFSKKNLGNFSSGEYVAVAAFWGDKREDPIIVKGYTFTMPAIYPRMFSEAIEQYKSGAGILFPSNAPQGPVITLRPIHDAAVMARLRSDFRFLNQS